VDSDRIIKMFEEIGMEEPKKTFTPYTEQFKIELGPAKRAENWVRETLEKDFGTVLGADDTEVHYDLLIRKTGKRVEVKYDKGSKGSGMLAIELESYGRYKGILRSKSDFYAIVCYDRDWSEIVEGVKKKGMWICIIIPTAYLREMVAQKPYKEIYGGDNKKTKMALVPLEDVREASSKIYPIIK
jgi:hypothetical protein